MGIDPKRMMQRVIERNPDADEEDLIDVIVEEAMENPELEKAIIANFLDVLYPIVKKLAAGAKLTAEEKAKAAALGFEHL